MTGEESRGRTTQDEKPVKFADAPRSTAAFAFKSGEEAATVRYEDEKDIQEGDIIAMLTPEGDRFGTARVTFVAERFAWRAMPTIWDRGARYGSDSTGHLMSKLNHHYEDTIWPSTRVKVIVYEVIELDQ